MIYFTRYVHSKWINDKGKKCLMVDDCIRNKVLHNIKEIIDIEKFDHIEILIDTDDQLSHDITLKNAVKWITCDI